MHQQTRRFIGVNGLLVAAAALTAAASPAGAAGRRQTEQEELRQLRRQVQELMDKEAIRQQIATYCRAMDRMDTELAKTVFHRNSTVDYGAFKGSGWAFADNAPKFQSTLVGYLHGALTISIWLRSGTTARSEYYGDTTMRARLPDGNVQDRRALVRYVDDWVKEDDRWQIMRRRMLSELDQLQPPRPPGAEPAGRRDRTDPSYLNND